MRIFNNESMWDAENQQWYDTYSINGKIVVEEIYHEQLEVEMLVADDEMELEEESYLCKCCSCDNDDCDEYNCTCNKPYCCDDEYLNDENCVPCQCETCCEYRGEFDDEDECEFCTCEYCTEEREQSVISEFLDMLFNPEGACRECVIEKFIDSLYTFKNFGIKEAKENMREFLDN